MTIFDETASIQAPIHLVWKQAYNLARKGRIERVEENSVLFASHLKLGYVYLMRENADGSTFIRHVIDTASKVKEAFANCPDPWKALDELAALTDTPGRDKTRKASGILKGAFALVGMGEAGELFDSSYIHDTGKAQLARIRKKSERAAKK